MKTLLLIAAIAFSGAASANENCDISIDDISLLNYLYFSEKLDLPDFRIVSTLGEKEQSEISKRLIKATCELIETEKGEKK